MTLALILSGALGAGLWLIVMGQPVGRPRPDLSLALQRLSAQGRGALGYDAARTPMFSSPLLERVLRPLLDDAGDLLGRLLRRVGIEAGDLGARLALAMPEMTAAQFRGQQLATGVIAAAVFPLMNLLGVQLAGAWPVWTWLAGFGLGFAAPSWQLNARLRRRHLGVLAETPVALDLFVLGASAGLSPEQALVEAGRQLDGVLGGGLREVVREAGLGTTGYAEGLDGLAAREDVPELRSLADAWRLSREQGMPLAPAMLALAESARDRQRTRLLEEGGKAAVRMLFPIVLFIFPVFLVVLLYPAGVQLLGIGR
ncbi:MAG: hypothetical protein C4558_02360 [Dehalococcoidia bacterium]|nr:MAG: hypothetical protein C4558_02360 [Dehalococcoidia bacterium]